MEEILQIFNERPQYNSERQNSKRNRNHKVS